MSPQPAFALTLSSGPDAAAGPSLRERTARTRAVANLIPGAVIDADTPDVLYVDSGRRGRPQLDAYAIAVAADEPFAREGHWGYADEDGQTVTTGLRWDSPAVDVAVRIREISLSKWIRALPGGASSSDLAALLDGPPVSPAPWEPEDNPPF